MILDGVVPLDWTLGPSVAGDAQSALDFLFSRCSADTACKDAFPDLEQDFQTVLQRLQAGPIEMKLIHPNKGNEVDFTLNLETFTNTVHLFSYAQETAALLPLLINQAAAKNDYRPLAAQALVTLESVANQMSPGMRYSVLCSEDVPFMDDAPASTGYFGDWYLEAFKQVCETWPAGEIPPDFKQPVQTNVPTLLLSGEADPVTPPQNGEQAARTLPNSLHVVAPSQGHINIFRGCIPKIAASFIESASISNLDVTCVEEIIPMPVFINFNGPQP
jgi:pimeloyl-ACP methyl ester carboxylesterase